MADHILGLKCTICGEELSPDEVLYVCPKHGNEGILDVIYDYDLIARRLSPEWLAADPTRSIWRYLPLLPVEPAAAQELVGKTMLASVGWTPLYPAPRLGAALGLRHLFVKDDGRQPTASFKDRASAIAVIKTRELGYPTVTTASTGNAAAALSGLCAAISQPNVIFVPRTAPTAKIAQLLVYGATVLLVDGSYDDAFELCLQAAPEFGWYNRNTGYNPYMSEGKKTAAYEICEQLTDMDRSVSAVVAHGSASRQDGAPLSAPDRIFIPVGDGCIIGGIHKGLRDLMALGWIERMPKLMGVQAAGSSPLVEAWEQGLSPLDMEPVAAHSIADSIVAGLPRDRIKALRAVRESDGRYLSVSDEEIVAAIPALAQGCGVFSEPAAAAAYAGLVKAVELGLVDPEERVVVMATGSGLKDTATAMKSVGEPHVIEPTMENLRRLMSEIQL